MRSHATSSDALSTRRCFRTSADGRIRLAAHVPTVWNALRQLPRVVLQTRHASARLIGSGPLPPLHFDRTGVCANFDAGELQLRLSCWSQACARLEPCLCCGSPGRIEVLNTVGAEFLQFCAAPECPLVTWSDLLDPLAPGSDTGAELVPLTGGISLPLLSEHVEFLPESPDVLAPLLAGLADANIAIRCTLLTGEARHERVFCPGYIASHDGLLTVHDDSVTCQLALPAVTALAVDRSNGDWQLHATGPGGTQLLSFSASPHDSTASAWIASLTALFPSLR